MIVKELRNILKGVVSQDLPVLWGQTLNTKYSSEATKHSRKKVVFLTFY